MFLTDLIGGKAESDLERAVDRFFLGKTISSTVSSFFDPDERRKRLEIKLMEQALTSDPLSDNITSAAKTAAYSRGILKAFSKFM
jgi:hypothetical protein